MRSKNREQYIYMNAKIRMSTNAMSSFLYAAIITKASIPTTFGIGIYDYDRSQNSYNMVDVVVHLHPEDISKFEELSKVKLTKPIVVNVN